MVFPTTRRYSRIDQKNNKISQPPERYQDVLGKIWEYFGFSWYGGTQPKRARQYSKMTLKRKQEPKGLSSLFDYHCNSKDIGAKFCEKNLEQLARSRDILPKLLPNILKMTCIKGQHPIFVFLVMWLSDY